MSNRLDQEREARLQPKRVQTAMLEIAQKGYVVTQNDPTCLHFYKDGNLIRFFPYSGWHTGKGIKDGRGLENLLRQI